MADKTSLDPDLARMENAKLRAVSNRFGDSVARIEGATKAYDGCWGGDEFGNAFAQGYVSNSAESLKNIGMFRENIKTTVEQIDEAIRQLENADKENAGNVG